MVAELGSYKQSPYQLRRLLTLGNSRVVEGSRAIKSYKIYCMNCIKSFWDDEDEKKIHSCPQCRQTFTPRPVLVKNTMLADLVEELKKTGLQAAPADHCYAGPEDVACDVCTGRKLKAVKSCLACLASYSENPGQRERCEGASAGGGGHQSRSADKAVEDSEKIFSQLIRLIQKRSSDVKQQLRSQQETEVSRVKELQEKLEQEITELKRKDADLKQLSHTEDHTQFLHNYPSLSALSQSTDSSSIKIRPLRYFEDVTAAVSEVRDKLQDVLTEKWTNISLTVTEVDVLLPQPEPKTRAEVLQIFTYNKVQTPVSGPRSSRVGVYLDHRAGESVTSLTSFCADIFNVRANSRLHHVDGKQV
ncbi:hypothetical protein L3Q82_021187, partial [Scortum barcoo]